MYLDLVCQLNTGTTSVRESGTEARGRRFAAAREVLGGG